MTKESSSSISFYNRQTLYTSFLRSHPIVNNSIVAMGKKGGKSGGGGGGKKGGAASTPKCTCDHPYQCSCGNRPERPSKGHKWYPEEQIWAGKGHKQKGASGQTASVSKDAVVTRKGQTKIEQWQKLPSQLLADICKKEKRPPPKYKALDKHGSKHKYRCIVQDAKQSRRGGEHDLILIPREAVDNEEQAREESALLALLQLTPKIPHERKLPEPYKTTWTNAVKALSEGGGGSSGSGGAANAADDKKDGGRNKDETGSNANTNANTSKPKGGAASSSNLALSKSYSTLSEKRKQMDEKRRLRNARIAKHEAIRTANRDHQVYMSASVRKRIETLLRGDYSAALALGDDDEEEGNEDNARDDDGDEVREYVLQRLGHESFTTKQAKTAYGEIVKSTNASVNSGDVDEQMDSVYEECLQWLCIHLDEDQLPEGFDPRGRTLDVVVAGAKKKSGSNGSSSSSKQSGKSPTVAKNVVLVDFASKYGITDEEAECILKSAGEETEKARTILWAALNKAASVELKSNEPNNNEETNEILEEELEALQAIFPPEECDIKRQSGVDGKQTKICISFPSDDGWTMHLEVIVLDNQYPNSHPTAFISGNWRSGKMPQGVGTAVHIELCKFMSTLALGDPMVYELYGFVQGIMPSLPDGLSVPISSGSDLFLLSHLDGGEAFAGTKSSSNPHAGGSTTSKGGKPSKTGQKTGDKNNKSASSRAPAQQRPREKSFFWSKKPKQTPAAIAFPKLSASMEKTRKSLPAAKARKEFLSIMQKAESTGRVVLVTGETGCGKVWIMLSDCFVWYFTFASFFHIITLYSYHFCSSRLYDFHRQHKSHNSSWRKLPRTRKLLLLNLGVSPQPVLPIALPMNAARTLPARPASAMLSVATWPCAILRD